MCFLLSASVLDRLNALLEPNGSLTINERGVIDGKTPRITPHPNFRLALAGISRFGWFCSADVFLALQAVPHHGPGAWGALQSYEKQRGGGLHPRGT